MSEELVRRLRETAEEKHGEAWRRIDGGQDLSIGAMLADEAADRIAELEAERDRAEALLKEAVEAAEFLTIAAEHAEGHIMGYGRSLQTARINLREAIENMRAFLARMQEGRAQGDDDGRA